MATSTELLAQQIEGLRRQLSGLIRTPQLTSSSIDNGALQISQTTVDANGNPIGTQTTGYVGQQYDGTNGIVVVVGPKPPTPTAPTVETVIGGIRVTWDGHFVDPQAGFTSPVVAPQDYLRVDIEVATDPAFPGIGFGPVHGSIQSAAGGSVTVSWPASNAAVYVRLKTVTTAGKYSDPGGTVAATTGQVQLGDLGFNINDYAGGNTIFFGASSPTAPAAGFTVGDLWLQDTGTTGSTGQPLYLTYRWMGSAWVLLQDQGISQSLANAAFAQSVANSKALVFAQASQPTASGVGDVWIDTNDGNAMYVWGPTSTVARRNWAVNPSFEYDAAGTLTPTGWVVSSGGTTGTVTKSVVATGAIYGTKVGKIVGAGLSTLNTAWVGYQQTIPAVAADILQLQAWIAYGVTSASQRPEWMVEWLNASGAVISTLTDTAAAAMGTAGSRTYAYTTTAAPALTTNARITLRRRGTLTTGGATVTNADLSIDAVLVERNRPANALTDYFDGGYPTTTESIWDTPSTAPNSTSTYWQPGTSGANAWQKQMLRSGAIQPQSLIAGNVIATGTVSAALLEANMILATTVYAGPVSSDHSAMAPDGFHVYRIITGEGLVEVGRLGTGTSGGFLGFVDSSGKMVAQIDDAGGISGTALSIDGDPVFGGTSLSAMLSRIPAGGGAGTAHVGARNYIGWDPAATASGITSEYGLIEVSCYLEAGRIYHLIPSVWWTASATTTYLDAKVRDGGSGVPSIASSPTVDQMFFTTGNNAAWSLLAERTRPQRFTTGTHRLLLTVAAGNGGSVNVVNPGGTNAPMLSVIDAGPDYGNPALVNRGGGGTGTPTQQYYVDLAPSGTQPYQGNGTARTDTSDIVQGWDPSGFNGDGSGWWTFTMPSITGTVDRVDWYVYCNHTYYNSGGQGLWRPIHFGPPNFPMSSLGNAGIWNPGVTYPNGGGVQVTLPSSWFAAFANSGAPRSVGIAAGPEADVGGGTAETYYCRFDGPSARLRIWYTQ